jgi:hypothetical protein
MEEGREGLAEVGEEGAGGAVEGAAAEDHGGDGAGGLGVGEADEAAGFGFVHGHLGDEGNTHACADHGEEAEEMSAFEDHARIEAGAIAGSNGSFAEAVAIAEKEEGIGAEVRELQRRTAGELVFFGESGVKAFGEERMGVEFVAADGQCQDGEIHGTGAETIEEDRSDFFGDGEMDFGKFAGEAGEARGQPVGRDGGNGADDHWAGFGLQALGDFVLGGGEFVQNGTRAWEKCGAEFGEADGATESIEEAATEFGFEFEDLLGEGGLGDVAFFRSAGKRGGVGDGTEVTELVEFHWEDLLSVISNQ